MLGHKDYLSSLNKARKKRDQRLDPRYLVLLLAAITAVGIIALGVKAVKKPVSGKTAGPAPTEQVRNAIPAQANPVGISPEKKAALKEVQEVDNVTSSYNNLEIARVSGYFNIRETSSIDGKIIGKLSGDGACEILVAEGDWSRIISGGVEGYISNRYLLTGNEAREKVKELVKLHTTVMTDNLNIRQAPALGLGNVIGQALKGEHCVAKGLENDWIQTEEGCVSSRYAEMTYSLNKGRKVDMKAMAINQYDDLVISKANDYLNTRREPKSDSRITGKMTSKAAGEILETLGGWYKIKSDPVIDYISADPRYTAADQEARNITMQNAALKAIIDTDMLNMRTEPNTGARIWTQVVKDERYPAVAQLDGWVEIDLDSVDEEGTSKVDEAFIPTGDNNVEVHYALNKAIRFPPAETAANNAVSRRSKVVNYALQYVGNPCVRGGTSLIKDVDYSGPAMQVMRRFGASLPHYSGSQARMGKVVTSGNMRPDNLISCAGSNGQVNHVVIYAGNGQVVHAASRKSGIKISTWNYGSPMAIRNALGD